MAGTQRFSPYLLCAVVAAVVAPPAAAQRAPAARIPRPDYVRIRATGEQEETLKRLLQQAAQRRELERLLEDLQQKHKQLPISLEQIEQLRHSNDPALQQRITQLKDIVEKQILPSMDPKEVQKLKDAFSKLELPPTKPGNAPDAPPAPEPNGKPAPSPPPPDAPPDDGEEDDSADGFSRWLQERVNDLSQSEWKEIIDESPALQKALLDMERSFEMPEEAPFGLDWRELTRHAGSLPLPKENLSLLEFHRWNWNRIALERLPQPRLHRIMRNVSGPTGPLTGAAPSGDLGALAVALFLAVVLGGAAWALLFAFPFSPLRRAARREAASRPWPVDPASIHTAAELIAAFDHLALLLFGAEARSWNHRTVARQIGEWPERAELGQTLAALYEQARYAPQAPLGPAELNAARRCLCALAGVAAP